MRQVRVFLSYAHEDREWCERLLNQLGWLRQTGQLAVFDDQQIRAGEGWDARIKGELEGADIVVPLVSPAFLGSRYCTVVELLGALRGRARVIPVVLDYVDFAALPLSELQALPKDERQELKPLVDWDNPNRPLAAVAKAIREAVGEIGGDPGPTPVPPLPPREEQRVGTGAPGIGTGRIAAAVALAALAYFGLADAADALPAGLGTLRSAEPLLFRAVALRLPALVALSQLALEVRQRLSARSMRERVIRSEVRDPGYFRLTPYGKADRGRFARADRAQERALGWVEGAESPVLYLTGDSGVGKSSLLDAFLV